MKWNEISEIEFKNLKGTHVCGVIKQSPQTIACLYEKFGLLGQEKQMSWNDIVAYHEKMKVNVMIVVLRRQNICTWFLKEKEM